jgi:hypothetical protein
LGASAGVKADVSAIEAKVAGALNWMAIDAQAVANGLMSSYQLL